MPGEVFGRAVDDDVSAELERPLQQRRRERVVDHDSGARRVRAGGRKVATAHLRYLNPFPRNTGEVVRGYDKVLIPEMNLGQLRMLVRAEFLVDAAGYNKVRGRPFGAAELEGAITVLVDA